MEIKGIGGVINTYKPQKISTARKAAASVGAKKTDRVEFGFDTALTAAKNEIAREAAADASEPGRSASAALPAGAWPPDL